MDNKELIKKCCDFINNNGYILKNIIKHTIEEEEKRIDFKNDDQIKAFMLDNEVNNLKKLLYSLENITKEFEIDINDIPF